MKRVGTIAACLAGGLVLNTTLRADDEVLPGNPYANVVARNIFGLNPPAPVDPNANAPEPPVKIVPNGIMSIFGQLQVLFKVPAKPGGKDANYILMEGQSQDDIEVTKINEKAGVVTFNNHGIVQELPLVVTAPTPTPSVPTGGAPGAAPAIAPGAAPAGGTPGNNPFSNRFGNRPGRGGNNNPAGGGGNNGINTAGATDDGLRSVPTRNGIYQPQALPQVDPAATAAQLLINTEKMKMEGNPAAKLMPPVPGFNPDQQQ
jgi:hypothetical protein